MARTPRSPNARIPKSHDVAPFRAPRKRSTRRPRRISPRRMMRRVTGALMAIMIGAALLFGTNDGQERRGETSYGREILSGQVSHVRDGDTIEVAGTPVRIANLDCAEMDTAAGRRARDVMVGIAARGEMTCQLEGRMSYDREVGTCSLAGRDIGEEMIAGGFCARW